MPTKLPKYEYLDNFRLDPDREQELLNKQRECTFIWTNKKGEPVGVTMVFLAARGKIWFALTEMRARVAALRRDPRSCICISSIGTDMGAGKMITYKGMTVVHRHDAPELNGWFFREFAKKLNGNSDSAKIEEISAMLDIPERAVLEFTPAEAILYDGEKRAAAMLGNDGEYAKMYK